MAGAKKDHGKIGPLRQFGYRDSGGRWRGHNQVGLLHHDLLGQFFKGINISFCIMKIILDIFPLYVPDLRHFLFKALESKSKLILRHERSDAINFVRFHWGCETKKRGQRHRKSTSFYVRLLYSMTSSALSRISLEILRPIAL